MKRSLGVLAALALGVGLSVSGVAVAAHAHQGNISASAVCDTTTGNYVVTYTLTWSNVPEGVSAPILSGPSFAEATTPRGTATSPSGSVQWTGTIPGTSKSGPWEFATTYWSNNHSGETQHDTRVEGLKGDCKIPEPEPIPNSLETWHTSVCGSAEIFLRNISPWIYPVSVEVDGVHSYGPTVDNRTDGKLNGPQKDATKSKTFTFDEDSGTHTVRYRIDAGSEKDLYKGLPVGEWTELTVESDCEESEPTPTPEPPVEEPPTLAQTGAGDQIVGLLGGGLALLAGLGLLFAGKMRRSTNV